MARWFWFFIVYSFLGYCLEKLFACATHSPRQVRKCFLLLPLCPVYGLGMTAVLALIPPALPFPVLAAAGGILCTAAEYLVHLFYDRVFAIRFWDYSSLSCHIRGRVCPRFSLVWGLLSAAAIRLLHPAVETLTGAIPPAVSFVAWLVLAADCVCTASLLLRFHNTELLSLSALLTQE